MESVTAVMVVSTWTYSVLELLFSCFYKTMNRIRNLISATHLNHQVLSPCGCQIIWRGMHSTPPQLFGLFIGNQECPAGLFSAASPATALKRRNVSLVGAVLHEGERERISLEQCNSWETQIRAEWSNRGPAVLRSSLWQLCLRLLYQADLLNRETLLLPLYLLAAGWI